MYIHVVTQQDTTTKHTHLHRHRQPVYTAILQSYILYNVYTLYMYFTTHPHTHPPTHPHTHPPTHTHTHTHTHTCTHTHRASPVQIMLYKNTKTPRTVSINRTYTTITSSILWLVLALVSRKVTPCDEASSLPLSVGMDLLVSQSHLLPMISLSTSTDACCGNRVKDTFRVIQVEQG